MSTLARSTDPITSLAAAESLPPLRERQLAVLRVLRANGPLSDEHVVAMYPTLRPAGPQQSESGIRTRRCELRRLGLVADTGRRSRTRSGRTAIVWQAT